MNIPRISIIEEPEKTIENLPYNTVVEWISRLYVVVWSDNEDTGYKQLVRLDNMGAYSNPKCPLRVVGRIEVFREDNKD